MAFIAQTLDRPEVPLPGPIAGRFLAQNYGQPTGWSVGPIPASQLAGIRPPKNHAITPRFAPLVTSTSPFWSPFVVRGRHGDRDLIPTPDEVAICIPKVAICAKTATHLLFLSDWPNLGGKLQKGPLEGPKW